MKFPNMAIPVAFDWRSVSCLSEFANIKPEDLAQGCSSYEELITKCQGFITDPLIAAGFVAYVENRVPVRLKTEFKRALHLPISKG